MSVNALELAPGLVIVLLLALVVRLLSLRLLRAAQRDTRQRAEAAREGRAGSAGFPAAAVGELALGLAGSVGLVLLVRTGGVVGFELLDDSIAFGHARELVVMSHLPWTEARIWFVVVAVLLLGAGLLLWSLTQRNLWAGGPAGRAQVPPAVTSRLVGLFVLRAVVGLFVPVCLVAAALLVQAVALLASQRAREAGGAAAAPFPPLGYAPGPVPPVPSMPPVPVQQPSVQASAHQVVYVPTQADPGAAAGASGVPAHRPAYQELNPGEPRTVGGYRLLGRIGAGGMGTVYLAQREGSATQVALKTLNPELLDDSELLRRFEREGRVLAMVPGAYTARVLDTGVEAGRPYLAMELLDGRPLDVHLRELGPIREPQALRALALALAVALSEVHRLGLVHRDLKPGNIMLTTAGPRLLDFGIAAMVDGTRLTRTGGGPGTLTYMAPEQLDDGAVGPAADIWAWACCVVCAAHGASPFAATSTGAVIRRIVDTGPEPLALGAVQALDPALAAVVGRALTADPAARPADGAALVRLLTAAQADPTPHSDTLRDQITRGWRTLAL